VIKRPSLYTPLFSHISSPNPKIPKAAEVNRRSIIGQTPTFTTTTLAALATCYGYEPVDTECDESEDEEEDDDYYRYYVVFLDHFDDLLC
jgi:hypothetical protein